MSTSVYSQDTDLAKYFTDLEPLRGWFEQAVAAQTMPKRLLVIWGVGGIGKSSVLRMFRLSARSKKIPVGLASGDEAKSAVDVLARWADDLKADGTNLPTFFKTYEHYRAIQAQVDDKAKAANKKWGDAASKAAGKAAEAGAAAAVGAVVGSVIPGIGTVAGAVGGMGAEALVDWLRGFLTKPDIDLYIDPTKKLTDDFLTDVDKVAAKQRIVLMLDTYEQMTALDDWTRDVAERINPNVLMVIAGRAMPDWSRQWPAWLSYAQVEELKPMTKRVMHELIRKYYATMRGGEPNPKQVNAIIEFSGGLPMVVNTAVQLWVKYGVEDFGAVKGEVVKAVVERLREGVPPKLYPLLETAAALRYFNKDILRTVSGMGDITFSYEELLRFPFVRRRAEGYALHDRVREMIEENVRTDDPTKYRNVHERAAAYFQVMSQNVLMQSQNAQFEQMYHLVCADEKTGMELFQEVAEIAARHRHTAELRTVLNESLSINVRNVTSVFWRVYYLGRLAYLEGDIEHAELSYSRVIEQSDVSPKLRAYALSSLGHIRARWHRLGIDRNAAAVIKLLQESVNLVPIDERIVNSWIDLARVYEFIREWDIVASYIRLAQDYYAQTEDYYGALDVISEKRGYFAQRGDWPNMVRADKNGSSILDRLPKGSYFKARFLGSSVWAWIFLGDYAEAVRRINISQPILADLDEIQIHNDVTRDLALTLAMQEKYVESEMWFEKCWNTAKEIGPEFRVKTAYILSHRGYGLTRKGNWGEADHAFRECLAIIRQFNLIADLPEILTRFAYLHECMGNIDNAFGLYRESLEFEDVNRKNCICEAFTGLSRLQVRRGEFNDALQYIATGLNIAEIFEYNDHLASLRLTQGHIAWDRHIPEWGKGFDAAFEFYKLALVYALRYNRFLLDEVLSERPQGTPLRPIIPECLKRGEEGRKMLVALREWWQTETNDVGTPRPDTISPIPENIALLEAEKIAREREPGDGSPQTNVVARIDAALQD